MTKQEIKAFENAYTIEQARISAILRKTLKEFIKPLDETARITSEKNYYDQIYDWHMSEITGTIQTTYLTKQKTEYIIIFNEPFSVNINFDKTYTFEALNEYLLENKIKPDKSSDTEFKNRKITQEAEELNYDLWLEIINPKNNNQKNKIYNEIVTKGREMFQLDVNDFKALYTKAINYLISTGRVNQIKFTSGDQLERIPEIIEYKMTLENPNYTIIENEKEKLKKLSKTYDKNNKISSYKFLED